ncbi:MAG TPA: hypothetical protein VHC72_21135 [Bryobacteraceae bacterium]|nr:hypothetical protein [Bryobacteraceae bacterium]
MFELLFKYPPAIFSKGKLVLLAPWPFWTFILALLIAVGVIVWFLRERRNALSTLRLIAIGLAQAAMIAIVLFMLWRPAMSVARLRPQQNVVAVMVDDSRSMGMVDSGNSKSRLQNAEDLLNGTVLPDLEKKFQVRLYSFGRDASRLEAASSHVEGLNPSDEATRIGDSLRHIAAEASTMPLGAVVLLTDGGDNTGGVDRETLAQIRQLHLPVHTIGFGPDHFNKDIEVMDVDVPARVLANSRVTARVNFRQHGLQGQKINLMVRENGHPLAKQEITLKPDVDQSETVMFNAGPAGAHTFQIGIDPVMGEQNSLNNYRVRLVNISEKKRRVLFFDGEPQWEFKFIRRALEDDPAIEIVSIVRTTENKTYRQGISNPKELEGGFPDKPEDLFVYDGLIIGSEEANYFSPAQQAAIRDFADRRGGGVLFLAGRFALSDGGYANTPMAEMMPLRLMPQKSFSRNFAVASLTDAGKASPILRLEDNADANDARWKKMPQIANYAVMGAPKPGATVLMNVGEPGKRTTPLLAIVNYGHGRTAVLATSGTWRWQMLQDHTDMTHETFWQQLLRWLVTETPGQVSAATPHQMLNDDGQVHLRAVVRDKTYQTVTGATVTATINRPDGAADTLEMKPDPLEPGAYAGDYTADKSGAYVAEVTANDGKVEVGRDALNFRREDGVAENFNAAQNKDLLQRLSADTGGNYYTPGNAKRLGDEVAISEAGISGHDSLDIWDMPILFLLLILIRAGEWLLRRKWGVV